MPTKKKWVGDVKTVSTYPPEDLFTKDAETIAKAMASKKVSPKGIGSGIRMIQYFINRGGEGLSVEGKRELEKAKRILQTKLKRESRDDDNRTATRGNEQRRSPSAVGLSRRLGVSGAVDSGS